MCDYYTAKANGIYTTVIVGKNRLVQLSALLYTWNIQITVKNDLQHDERMHRKKYVSYTRAG